MFLERFAGRGPGRKPGPPLVHPDAWARPIGLASALTSASAIQINRALIRRRYTRAGLAPNRIRLASGTLHYYRGGGWGPPLVLLHGFGFGVLETWDCQVPVFARRHQLLAPDLFWFGDSIPDGGMVTAQAQADALAEWLDRIDLRGAVFVGVSFGGYVAIELARRRPERIGGLVLVDSAGIAPTEAERAAIVARFHWANSAGGILIPKNVRQLRALLDTLFHKPRYIPRFVLKEILTTEFWRYRDVKERMCQHLESDLLPLKRLSEVRAPTLVLWGRHDPLLPPSLGERMARAIPHAELAFLEHSAHSPMMEEPARFNRLVLDFAARVQASQVPVADRRSSRLSGA